MDPLDHWNEVKALFRDSFRSSFHYAIATVNEDGMPQVTPIGSLILTTPGQGFYFEEFAHQLPRNLGADNRLCVLAVNSDRWFWLRSLIRGGFAKAPAIRLYGTAGAARTATDRERALWLKRVNRVRFTRGHALMWQDMRRVRDITFTRMESVRIGEMTRDLWRR